MFVFRSLVALGAAAAVSTATPAFAANGDMRGSMGGAMHGSMMASKCPPPPRFGGSNYCNNPKLTNTLALVVAGGGPANFSSIRLLNVLAGPAATAEKAKLAKQFGATGVKQYVRTFNFVIKDSLAIATAKHVALPAAPAPSPSDGKALSAALYMDGVDPKGSFSVEYMLDHLVSHPIHVQVMKDIDAKYGVKADTDYHAVTLVIFNDLKSAYGL